LGHHEGRLAQERKINNCPFIRAERKIGTGGSFVLGENFLLLLSFFQGVNEGLL
jgi:hypothetical protein